MFKGKLLYFFAAVVLALAVGGWFLFRNHSQAGYRTARVERGDIESTISATGNCNAVVTVQVGSQVSGNIKELHADFNTKVKKGQLVARIDPEIFQAKVDQAKATMESTRAAVMNMSAMVQKSEADVTTARAGIEAAKENLAKAKVAVLDSKVKLNRRLELANQGLVSPEDRETAQATYDSNVAGQQAAEAQVRAAEDTLRAVQAQRDVAKAQLAAAQAQVKQSEAALHQSQVDLEHTFIRAPVDGTVVARRMDVGQTVAASLQAPTLFEIAQDLTKMQVDVNVDEADIGRVQMGQEASFTVDAYPSMLFRGKVAEIRKAPINVQNVITYDVVVTVGNPELKLFPGMTANVKILVNRRSNVLKMSNAALRFRPPESKETPQAGTPAPGSESGGQRGAGSRRGGQQARSQTVWILGVDGKPQAVQVKLGITDGTMSQVIEGNLKEGDLVITAVASETTPSSPGTSQQPFGGRRPGF